MTLWMDWYRVVAALRPACARTRTFLWLVLVLAAFSIRTDLAGVTSLVGSHWLAPVCYHRLLYWLHSPALDLRKRIPLWAAVACRIFDRRLVRVGGRLVLLADGLKAPNEGHQMPAVKSLHQESAANTKPDFIMGHSCQAVSLLVQALGGALAVPLACRIHEGLVCSSRCRRTQLDKLVGLLFDLALAASFFLVADAYYASRKVAAYERHMQVGLIVQGVLQYLAGYHHRDVWRFFASWLRTTNRSVPPSELVVAQALRNTFPYFLLSLPKTEVFKQFIASRLSPERCPCG